MRFDTAVPIGQGGSGEVLRAWDPALRRHVALKLLTRTDPDSAARMLREARAQARVEHPNVCPIYEVGETADGRPFIAMQFVDGEALDVVASDLSTPAVARLVRDVALGVQAAHTVGLIHRDLKPANILVERRDDDHAHPWVLDFGIAKARDAEGLTVTGEAVGTPGFMSPEQIRGEARSVDGRTDVYGLGAVLYSLLCGRPPFVGDSQIDVMMQVLQNDPEPLRRLAPTVPVDLATITDRCLESDPDRRYRSVRAVADDLDRFLAGEPVAARPVGFAVRSWRWIGRNRMLASVVAAALFRPLGHGRLDGPLRVAGGEA